MIVAMFVQAGTARDKDDRPDKPGGGQHRPDPGMADDHAALLNQLFKFSRGDLGAGFHVAGRVGTLSCLSDYRHFQSRRKPVHRADQAIKSQLHTDGDKDHRTAPK
jgi:hypothetical protein